MGNEEVRQEEYEAELDLEPEEEEGQEGEAQKPEETVEALQKRIEELTREKDGIYREMMSERRTRQELKAQVDNISQILSEIKEKKGQDQTVTVGKKVIPVKFDDEGEAYIDPEDLAGITAQQISKLQNELATLRDQSFGQTIAAENANIVNSVLSEDPAYQQANVTLNQAYRFLDQAAERIIRQSGIDPQTLSLDDAVEMLERSPEVVSEFQERFPGLDIDMVVEANTVGANGLISARKLRKALRTIASSSRSEGKEKLNNLKLFANKPSNLASQRSRKGASGRTLNDIADLSLEDFENLSDADVKRLERALERMEG